MNDEKYVLGGKGAYNAKAPQSWFQDLHDYLAGCSIDLDGILNWAETQTSEISGVPNCGVGECPMFDQIPVEFKEVSRQFWAFLGPLAASDSDKIRTFKNVARHNGLEAWRQIAMPIN